MKRVGFILHGSAGGWLGGVNYLRNLLVAITSNPDCGIEPVLFLPPNIPDSLLSGFPVIQIIHSPLINSTHPIRRIGQLMRRLLDRDFVLEWYLRSHSIDVLSHSSALGSRSHLPSITWIPDFQHIRMPQFFSEAERRERDVRYRRMVKDSTRVILSSKDALNDFAKFIPAEIGKACVLHFVSSFEGTDNAITLKQLRKRFNIEQHFFHLPNQFWKHKNHLVVVEALGLLKNRGIDVLVLATGNTKDYRNLDYFEKLMARVKTLGVEKNFQVLGQVSYPELKSLMINAVAIINPSDFEGWSTTVEESKSLGLPIILSDIPVHMEQMPSLGLFFSAGNAEALADVIESAIREYNPKASEVRREIASRELPGRIRKFGLAYADIVSDSVQEASYDI